MTERKLTDDDVARLRSLASEEGWAPADLARAFGITPQHAGRLVRGDQRPVITTASGSVAEAVGEFLSGIRIRPGDEVLAATARVLAGKLDGCATSDTAGAAQAAPRVASQLVEVVQILRGDQDPEPDFIDEINARRAERLAGIRAQFATEATS